MIERITKSPRTTLIGVSAGLASLICLLGFNVDADTIAKILIGGISLLGLFSVDKDK